MADMIDITLLLRRDMTVWPGCSGVRTTPNMRMEKRDSSSVSHMDCDLNTGTHIDEPGHLLQDGATVEPSTGEGRP